MRRANARILPLIIVLIQVLIVGGKSDLTRFEFESLVRRQAGRCNCAMISEHPSQLPRLYMANRSGTYWHGLRHEIRNLWFVMKESLSLGRLLLLGDGPRLKRSHNMDVAPKRNLWQDYLVSTHLWLLVRQSVQKNWFRPFSPATGIAIKINRTMIA